MRRGTRIATGVAGSLAALYATAFVAEAVHDSTAEYEMRKRQEEVADFVEYVTGREYPTVRETAGVAGELITAKVVFPDSDSCEVDYFAMESDRRSVEIASLDISDCLN